MKPCQNRNIHTRSEDIESVHMYKLNFESQLIIPLRALGTITSLAQS